MKFFQVDVGIDSLQFDQFSATIELIDSPDFIGIASLVVSVGFELRADFVLIIVPSPTLNANRCFDGRLGVFRKRQCDLAT